MPYCPNCGAPNEPDASFCDSCGSRIADDTPLGGPPEGTGRGRASRYVVGAALLSVVVAVGVVAYLLVGGDDESDGERADALRTARPAAGVTLEPTNAALETPASEPPAATPAEPTAVPPPEGHGSPEDAIAAFLQERGVEYAGDCESISLDQDIGSYCSIYWEERPGALIYAIGLAFSEGDTWLLLEETEGGWTVADWAELIFDEPPPW